MNDFVRSSAKFALSTLEWAVAIVIAIFVLLFSIGILASIFGSKNE